MRKERFKNINLIALILLLLFVLLWNSCKEEKTVTPPPSTGCGVGEDEYGVYISQYPPSEFDCRYEGSFEIEFNPGINNSYEGFNRMYFRLKKGSSIYRSNYVEFYSDDEGVQQLEWGGSLPSGEYKVTGILENIQLNSTCVNSIYKHQDVYLGMVDITEFSNPQKVMQIEYFCQYSDIGGIDRYDVFLSPNTGEYIDIAFNVANTTYNLMPYGLYLEPEFVIYTEQEISKYIKNNKNWGWNMFLCGIKAFKDEYGNLLPNQLGVTYEDDWFTRAPSESTGSLVAVKTCIDYAALDEYSMDYNDLVTGMTIHELGLQRGTAADEHVPTKPYPEFCVGHRALIHYEEGTNRHHPYLFVRLWNPHFCDECITGIKNITW